MTAPLISAVIPTLNREALLSKMLDSLGKQTLAPDRFEIVVVDDGSTDDTPELCLRLSEEGLIRYRRITSGGIAQAKNFGLLAARAAIVLFLDDDDVAAPELLERHVEMHDRRPADSVAVLGYTTWASDLAVTPLMEYVTEIGHLLFAYPLIEESPLAYHYFWGGRTSCKRQFLLDHGIFNPVFTSIIEDIELAYRLAPFGLTIVHTRSAVTEMARGFSYDEFCERCERRGRGLALFSELHPEPSVAEFCGTQDALDRWEALRPGLAEKVARVREFEAQLPGREESLSELYELYGSTFAAFQLKGLIDYRLPRLALGSDTDLAVELR